MTLSANDMRALPLWAAVVPLLTFNACYLVAIALEHVPACIPYISGCTSVSSTGRMLPESLIFKAGMLPTAAVLVLFWYRCATFLQLGGQSGLRLVILRFVSIIGALSLIIYTVTLGLQEDVYRMWRRIGIDGFALSNLVAQVVFISAYRSMRIDATRKLFRWLIAFCLALPLLGIAAEVAKWAGAPRHAANNIVAWNAFLFLCAYFFVVGHVWRQHGFSCQFTIKSAGSPISPRE